MQQLVNCNLILPPLLHGVAILDTCQIPYLSQTFLSRIPFPTLCPSLPPHASFYQHPFNSSFQTLPFPLSSLPAPATPSSPSFSPTPHFLFWLFCPCTTPTIPFPTLTPPIANCSLPSYTPSPTHPLLPPTFPAPPSLLPQHWKQS